MYIVFIKLKKIFISLQLQKQIASTLCLQESLKSSNFELNELRANTTKDAQEVSENEKNKKNVIQIYLQFVLKIFHFQ